MRVYAVWSGEYSDAQQHALFVSRDLAESYIAALMKAERAWHLAKLGVDWQPYAYRVEEYDLWDVVPALDERGYIIEIEPSA